MKKTFICSIICRNGILGGGLYIDDTAIIYKTNKLTVDRKYRNLVLPRNEIRELSWKWLLFPIATLQMINGEEYKFIIFNKKRFEKCYRC
jgi:hypothetical protein